ncbi:MAG: MEKHLA domain-containing protein [bacterium]
MDFIETHGAELLRSYRHWTGRHLIEPCGDPRREARRLFEAPFAVVSGGAEGDQILNYGNKTAMQLWEMDWETLTRTPSRLTAEPMHRDERAAFLRRVREHGFIEDYSGIRISSRGRRFRICQATVWNVTDAAGHYAGQAATFSRWEFLGEAGANP